MTLRLFEGPAGSGKTTRLFAELSQALAAKPLGDGQAVLAVTKIHGSRRRMEQLLQANLGTSAAFDCMTLNAFALSIVQRWSALARTLCQLPADDDFAKLAALAVALLSRDNVLSWVAARHPLLVVDELQDLKGDELGVIRALTLRLDVLCAADAFQDLSSTTATSEPVDWARTTGTVTRLTTVIRTNVSGIVAAANAVRNATAPPRIAPGFKIEAVPAHGLAAWRVADRISATRGSLAVITPARPSAKAKFVGDVIARVQAKSFVRNKRTKVEFGPFKLPWELSMEDEEARAREALCLEQRTVPLALSEIRRANVPRTLTEWATRRASLNGTTEFPVPVIERELKRCVALSRSHAALQRGRCEAMTVHQAKNREFDHVVVLWPFNVPTDIGAQRRLLYNAITRAKVDCVVLVHDPKKSRTAAPPFA